MAKTGARKKGKIGICAKFFCWIPMPETKAAGGCFLEGPGAMQSGQSMVVDLVPAVLVFLLVSGGIAWVWSSKVLEAQNNFFGREAEDMADRAMENLVESPGYPNGWERNFADNVEVIGLAKRSGILHLNKTDQFFWRTGILGRGFLGGWHFNGNFADESGNGSPALARNGASTNGTGLWDTAAMQLDGISQYAEIDENPLLAGRFGFEGLEGTVSAWFITGEDKAQAIVSRKGENSGWYLGTKAGNICFSLFGIPESQEACAETDYAGQGWHHAAGIFDSDRIMLYLDGKIAVERELPGEFTYQAGSGPALTGKSGFGSPDYFKGSIEEFRVYGRALDKFEIDALEQWTGSFVKQKLLIGENGYYFRLAELKVGSSLEAGDTLRNSYGDLFESGKEEETAVGEIKIRRVVDYDGGVAIAELVLYRKA